MKKGAEITDQDIWSALESGDSKAALDLMMRLYGAAIYRFCRHMVGDEALAEDAHQQTFIQAFESLARFRGQSSVKTWLYSIARHRCLDAVKARGRHWARFIPLLDLNENEGTVDPGLDQKLDTGGRLDQLTRCLAKLKIKTRTAILLRFQDELSYPEMAQICRERPPTLQARVARALPQLRRCLEAEGGSA